MDSDENFLKAGPNEAVSLGSRPGVLHLGDESLDAEVSATARFRPRPRLVLECRVPRGDDPLKLVGQFLGDRRAQLELEGSTGRRDAIITRVKSGDPSVVEVVLQKGRLIDGMDEACGMIVAHLVNFPDFLRQLDGTTWRNHMILSDGEYEFDISASSNQDEVFNGLKAEGGYGITHWVSITKTSGHPIEFEEAEAELYKLHTFLSFARGSWVGLLAPRGVSEAGDILWTEWGERIVSEWQTQTSWWDRHNAQALESAYPGFSDRWNEEYWRDVISTAIYWYLRSNSAGAGAGVDGGVILTQAALEKVAWSRLVEEWKSLSGKGFGRLFASDQLRLLLSGMHVPLSIPPAMTGLSALGTGQKWDGPRAFTECRNELVHAARGKVTAGQRVPYYEVWNLGQWYLELALLSLSGFDDVYSDRSRLGGWVGEVQAVPWHSE